ncbi:helix-turn-helix transcriptional regulator [Vibrio splendidus]
MSVVAKRIKETRQRLALTQSDFGKMLGLDENTASSRINHYEKARHSPSYELMLVLSNFSDTPVSYFYEPDDQLAETIQTVYHLTNHQKDLVLAILLDLEKKNCSKDERM